MIDNDPALQFGKSIFNWMKTIDWVFWFVDIEDDLNQLGDLKLTEKFNDENSQLAQAHERIRQLEEMIDTLKLAFIIK